MRKTEIQEFLTKADVARLAGITPGAIRLAAELGKLRVAARTPNGSRLFARGDVEQYLRNREAGAR